jgi:hypothetical protein
MPAPDDTSGANASGTDGFGAFGGSRSATDLGVLCQAAILARGDLVSGDVVE